ncbi:hypothetical protein BLA60_40155 [Actinophytocola xinjiangensis]|uniref:Uncharacterized protein n=1 Tax=Actinophytocola xinjiangensis TaxID=485602 RepID=A0A7Z0WE49_9PSEU|nr:hypothetical protein [Actinophytocola xinjiangensis]OLF04612.1 hypothetical protein BLA60_40155 [Actinophytocola xinjiangensis]
MAQLDLQRMVTRNTNDIAALYELSTETNDNVKSLKSLTTTIDQRLTNLETLHHQFAADTGERLRSIERTVNAVAAQLSTLTTTIGDLSARQTTTERHVIELKEVFTGFESRTSTLEGRVDGLVTRMDRVETTVDTREDGKAD